MTERQLQFRVGLFVIAALATAGVMVFQFGELRSFWEPRYTLAIHFDSAPGVYPSTPVRRNGIAIGSVKEITFDDRRGGVRVLVEIREEVRLRKDAEPRLVRSLLGDASIEFTPGSSPEFLRPGAELEGTAPRDPLQIVSRFERKTAATLESFRATSREWHKVGQTVNELLETNRGNLATVVERSATALDQLTRTMQHAESTFTQVDRLVGNPENQENLRKTLRALPELVSQTRETVATVQSAVKKADQSLENVNRLTGPLADKSTSIAVRLDNTMAHLESMSEEFSSLAQLANRKDGSVRRFLADPELYRNLNRSATSLSVLLRNLEPVVRDLRIFSDKVARHPELMGIRGALQGSSGLKLPAIESPELSVPDPEWADSRRR